MKGGARSLVPVGLISVATAAGLLLIREPHPAAALSITLWLWLAVVVAVDLWSYRFSSSVHWSYGSAVIAAPMVLSVPGSAPVIGAILSAAGAFTDSELRRVDLGRFTANLGQLALTGYATGVAFEALRPHSSGPSVALAGAVALAFVLNVGVNAVLVGLSVAYARGKSATSGMFTAAGLLGWRKVVAAVAAATIASTVVVVGPGWIAVALVQVVALGAVPIARTRLEARRQDTMRSVVSALTAWGMVGAAHERLVETTVVLGHRLHLNAGQIEQLRYLALLYSMTDHFAKTLPRSFEEQLSGLGEDAFSSALLLGMPLGDVADPRIVRIAEIAAEYESLVRPVDGSEPEEPNEAAAELLRTGAEPDVVAALLSRKPLSQSYLRGWEIDAASLWQRPVRWLAEHAS